MAALTPNQALSQPVVGGDTNLWGSELNTNFGILDLFATLNVIAVSITGTSIIAANTSVEKVTTGASTITRTLPDATVTAYKGRTMMYKKVDSGAGTVVINGTSGQTIDGLTTYTLVNQWQYVTMTNDGLNWIVIGGN